MSGSQEALVRGDEDKFIAAAPQEVSQSQGGVQCDGIGGIDGVILNMTLME